MRRFATVFTNLMFVAHILFGCCLHHAHGHETVDANSHGTCEHHHGGQAAGHSRHGHDEAPVDGESPANPCDGGRCQFVKGESHRLDVTLALTPWQPAAITPIAMIPNHHDSFAANDLPAAARLGHCPLHRLYCALLI